MVVKHYTVSATSDSGVKYVLHVEDTYAVHDSSQGHFERLVDRTIRTAGGDILLQDQTMPGTGKFRAAVSGDTFTLPKLELMY